jgi:hypothetical protein
MRASEALCREQEALHIAKAANEPLPMRRDIALTAAKAWGAEAVLAQKRALKPEPFDALDAEITLEFALEADAEAQD